MMLSRPTPRQVRRPAGRTLRPMAAVWFSLAIAIAVCWARCRFVWEADMLRHVWREGELVHNRQWIIESNDWREPYWGAFIVSKFDMLEPLGPDDDPDTSFLYMRSAPRPYDASIDRPTRTYFNLAGFRLSYDEDIIPKPILIKRKTTLSVPYWAVEALCLLMMARLVRRALIRFRRKRSGRCLACGYDLRASRERCPECGWEKGAGARDQENPAMRIETPNKDFTVRRREVKNSRPPAGDYAHSGEHGLGGAGDADAVCRPTRSNDRN